MSGGLERLSGVLHSWLLSLVSPFTVRNETGPSHGRISPGIWGGPAFHLQRKPRIEFQEENQGRHWPIRAILNRSEVGGGVEGEGSEFFLGGLVSARNPCAFFPARPLCPWAIEYATPPAS